MNIWVNSVLLSSSAWKQANDVEKTGPVLAGEYISISFDSFRRGVDLKCVEKLLVAVHFDIGIAENRVSILTRALKGNILYINILGMNCKNV
jgi:hypothetical protein